MIPKRHDVTLIQELDRLRDENAELRANGRRFIDLGKALHDLSKDHSAWSQETFGPDNLRGPIGPLKHLAKEAVEAQENPTDVEEYADCLLLLLDASRRAKIKPLELIRAGQEKLEKNKLREWPKASADEPVEHVK